jgi:hypothetical protein
MFENTASAAIANDQANLPREIPGKNATATPYSESNIAIDKIGEAEKAMATPNSIDRIFSTQSGRNAAAASCEEISAADRIEIGIEAIESHPININSIEPQAIPDID